MFIIHKIKPNIKTFTLFLLSSIILTGCGSSNDNTNTTNDPTTSTTSDTDTATNTAVDNNIRGTLVDPYITDANVCLDLNGNNICEADEAITQSDENGQFIFERTEAINNLAQIIVLNRGSFQFPDYGYHNGIPYEVPLAATNLSTDSSTIVTPASTALQQMNIDAATFALILNQFSDKIGQTFTAEDIVNDPYSGIDLSAEISLDTLSRLKANLVIYSILRTTDSFRGLEGYEEFITTFATLAQQPNSAVYALLNSIVDTVSAGLNLELLNTFKDAIITGNQSIAEQSSGLAQPLPDLSGQVVLEVATAITDYLIDSSLRVITQELNQDSNLDFTSRFEQITTLANAQLLQSQLQLPDLISKLGPMAYGAVNKSHLASYSGPFEIVRSSIFNAIPYMQEGYNCSEGHFAIALQYNDPASPSSLSANVSCTSALPKQLGQQIQNMANNDAPIEDNLWANIPVGSVKVSEQANGCTFQGTIRDESANPIAFVPLYFSFPATGQEMYVQTDSAGEFSFTNIPIATELDYADPQYFFGSYAGVRAPHPAFKNKESVSDFNIRCETVTTFIFNPILKNLVSNTKITGNIASNIVGNGFRIEIQSNVPSNTLSPTAIDRAWIMETIEDESNYNHPHMDFDSTTHDFEVRALAGGDYYFRVSVAATTSRDGFEFDTQRFNVPAGQTTRLNLSLDEASQTYGLSIDGSSVESYTYNTN